MDEPAPSAEPPLRGTNLVALRDRREQVIASLTEHFAGDVLDVDEFDARIDAAHNATTIVALDRLVADLAPVPAAVAVAAREAATTALTVRDDPARPERKGITAVFGGFQRKGPWIVPRYLKVRCWMGGGVIDFREADFGPGVTELHLSCIMGGVEIIVPPELAVDCDVASIMGGVGERHASRNPDPGRAILRINGTVVLGGVEIQTRLPGESERDARKRVKRERKSGMRELPAARAVALPEPRDRDK